MKLSTLERGEIVVNTEILDDLVSEHIRGNVVIVVGSGASDYERFGVPILKQKLLDYLNLKRGGEKQLLLNTISYINKEPSKCSLEELLSVYSNVYDEQIHLFLKRQGIKPKSEIDLIPTLGYEIISHFISHKLIDYVISFNFDEYLEASLNDEIGEDDYEWVRSKHIFHKLAEDIEYRRGRLPLKPLLIKPHGTISYPATIRPTFETVQQFEKEKEILMEMVLNAASAILILGFSCPDPDFQKILKKLILKKPMKIFWVDFSRDFQNNNKMFKFAKTVLRKDCIFINDRTDDFLVKFADHLHQNFKECYPTITRHKIRDFFGRLNVLKSPEDLLRLEIIIYAIKTRGMFSLEGLLTCKRIDNYCNKMTEDNIKIKGFLEGIVSTGILKRNDNIKSTEVYYIPIFPENTSLANEILRLFAIQDKDKTKHGLLSDLIRELMQDFDFDFGSIDNYLYFRFYEPEIIRDYKELYEYTRNTIKSAREEMNIITETGEWILRHEFKSVFEEIKKKQIRINLILADVDASGIILKDDSHREVQENVLDKLKTFFSKDFLQVKYLPWDEHNIHMTINEEGSGIYFERKYKSPIFTPIIIEEMNIRDSEILKNEFQVFNKKAYEKP